MTSLWDNAFEKQKAINLDGALQICSRCKLPYPKASKECSHCTHLSDDELEQLRQDFNQRNYKKNVQTRLAMIWGLVIVFILFVIATLIM